MGSEIDAVNLVSSMTLANVASEAAIGDLPGIDKLREMAVEILDVVESEAG